MLYKPLRSTGIYSALFFATNEHRRRHEIDARQIQLLEGRHRTPAGSSPARSSI